MPCISARCSSLTTCNWYTVYHTHWSKPPAKVCAECHACGFDASSPTATRCLSCAFMPCISARCSSRITPSGRHPTLPVRRLLRYTSAPTLCCVGAPTHSLQWGAKIASDLAMRPTRPRRSITGFRHISSSWAPSAGAIHAPATMRFFCTLRARKCRAQVPFSPRRWRPSNPDTPQVPFTLALRPAPPAGAGAGNRGRGGGGGGGEQGEIV